MKHQALARVFSVVLVILCLVMLLAAVGMLEDTQKDNEAAQRHINKTGEELEEYRTLLEENSGKTEYAQMNDELTQRQEEHDKLSAEHRTELALHSATQGGIEMGIEAMDQADAQFAAGKRKFEKELANFNAMESAVGSAKYSFGALAGLGSPAGGEDGASRKQALLNAYGAALGAIDSASGALSTLGNYLGADQLGAIAGSVDLGGLRAGVQAGYDGSAAMPEEGYMDEATYAQLVGGYEMLRGSLAAVGQGVAGAMSAFDPMLAEGRAALDEAGKQIEQAEKQLYNARAQIWYEMGKLEDQSEELKTEKEQLELDSEELAAMEEETRAQKKREERIISLQVGFKMLEGVEDRITAGEKYAEVVESYLADYKADSELEYKGRFLTVILMIASAVLGIIALPAAYEMIRSRFMLIAPVLLCLVCAAAAQYISIALERGMLYSVLGVLIFAAIHLLVVIPKNKT